MCLLLAICLSADPASNAQQINNDTIPLVSPVYAGQVSLESAIFNRKAVRSFKNEPINLDKVSQIFWAGGGKTIDGITGATRSYPAAGGLYPLEFYLIAENIDSLENGIYRYEWEKHKLIKVKNGNFIDQLKATTYSSAFKSGYVPACIVVNAVYSRTTSKYGDRGAERYVPMAMGGSGQNMHLQAEALGLGIFIIGAFIDEEVKKVLGVESSEEVPLYIMPLGKKEPQ